MAEFRAFNPSNKRGTCLHCGRKLRWIKRTFTQGPREVPIPVGERPNRYAKAGDYGDGFFCGLRCGYQFGVLAAQHGNRFAVKGTDPV